jgi:ankyrin repeat protein
MNNRVAVKCVFFLILMTCRHGAAVTEAEEKFIRAISDGDEKAVASMLATSPALAKTTNGSGVPALVLSIGNEHPEIVELLLKKGADPNDAGKGVSTPVGAAMALKYSAREMKALINAGGNVNYTSNAFRQTPLMIVARSGDLEMAELLLKKGAKVNVSDDAAGWSVLHYAALGANADLVKLVIKIGAKLDATDKNGKTALAFAQTAGRTPWGKGKDYMKVIAALREAEAK